MCECRDMRAIGIFLKKILRKNALIIEINEPTLGMYDLITEYRPKKHLTFNPFASISMYFFKVR